MNNNLMLHGEIPPPPNAINSKDGQEVIRCWIVDGGLQVSFSPGVFVGSAETWGMLLSDVGRHIAEAFAQEQWDTLSNTKARMKEIFDAEWDKPSGVAKTGNMPKG